MNGQDKIDFCIKALKPCAKALSKLQYQNYLRKQNQNTAKLSNNPIVTTTLNLVTDIINSKLSKEKQVIEDAWYDGTENMNCINASTYYNNKFKKD